MVFLPSTPFLLSSPYVAIGQTVKTRTKYCGL